MRWFKKKVTPFDDSFSIIIEKPTNPGFTRELNFTVPFDYYAQLLSVSLYIQNPLLVGFTVNWLNLHVLRGGVVLYQGVAEESLSGAAIKPFHCFGLSGSDVKPIGNHLFATHRLPDQAFLYPFDVVRVFVPPSGDTYNLTNMVVVMKQWKTD